MGGVEFRGWGVEFSSGSRFEVQDLGCTLWRGVLRGRISVGGARFGVQASGFRFVVQGLGLKVEG